MAAVAATPQLAQRATFRLAGRALGVEVEDEATAHILRTTYADARVGEPRTVHHTASLRRLGDGRLHVRFDRRSLPFGEAAFTDPLLSAYYATKEVFARFAVAHPNAIAFYAACVAVDDAAILILGPTRIGKTLFALHLVCQGAVFLGDETAVLELRSGCVSALARRPTLREAGLDLLPNDDMRARVDACGQSLNTERGRFWYALGAQDLCGIVPSDRSYRLKAVCIVRDRAEQFSARRIDLSEALPAIAQRAYERPSQLGQISGLRRAMRNVASYEVTLGLPQVSAAAFLDEFRSCG